MQTIGSLLKAVPLEAILNEHLSKNDLRVFFVLASFMGKTRKCSPSLLMISEKSGIDPTHLPTHINHLVEKDYIRKTRRGKRLTNLYSLGDGLREAAETSDLETIVRNEITELAAGDRGAAA